uniref:hypothetical protein n=1 Tax=Nocardia vinacea TaxID=96468 RepID=UPI000593C7E9
EIREGLREQLLQRFPGANIEWNDPGAHPLPPWIIAGEKYPTIGQQTRVLTKFGLNNIAGVYDTLSLSSHPNILTLTMAVDRTPVGDHVELTYRTDTEAWGSIVKLGSTLVHVAALAACGYLGGQQDHLTKWYNTYR